MESHFRGHEIKMRCIMGRTIIACHIGITMEGTKREKLHRLSKIDQTNHENFTLYTQKMRHHYPSGKCIIFILFYLDMFP